MSNYQTRDNSGSMFKNAEKKSDKHPDYSGNCVVDGAEYFFDAWIKTADSGRKWLSFSFKRKEKQAQAPQRPAAPGSKSSYGSAGKTGFEDMDDDIPF